MHRQEAGFEGMDWIDVAQNSDRWCVLMNGAMNLRVPQNVGNFLTNSKPISSSRKFQPHGVSIYDTSKNEISSGIDVKC